MEAYNFIWIVYAKGEISRPFIGLFRYTHASHPLQIDTRAPFVNIKRRSLNNIIVLKYFFKLHNIYIYKLKTPFYKRHPGVNLPKLGCVCVFKEDYKTYKIMTLIYLLFTYMIQIKLYAPSTSIFN